MGKPLKPIPKKNRTDPPVKPRAARGIARGRERANTANAKDDALQKKGEQAGHGVKLTRKEVKELKEREKNS